VAFLAEKILPDTLCLVFDMTPGCGSVMHGMRSGKRFIYKCGRYHSSNGTACYHNTVDAEAIAEEFSDLKKECDAKKRELESGRAASASEKVWDIDEEVAAALALFDDIERLVNCKDARADIRPLLMRLGLRIGLNFGPGIKGKKR
jgi:hypothetical protein